MNTLILYKTKHGSAKQYAEWLHEDLKQSTLVKLEDFDVSEFPKYDKVVIVSCTYMGDIKARNFLVKHWDKLKGKQVYLQAVGLVFSDDARKTYERIPEEIRNSITYSKIPGRLNYHSLNLAEKLLIIAMRQRRNVDKVERRNLRPVEEFMQKTAN